MIKPAKTGQTQIESAPNSPARGHYQVMRDANTRATERVVRLVEDLKRFTQPLLTNWSNCYIEIAGMATPSRMTEYRKAVPGDAVPSVQELRNALVDQFEAQLCATQAWNVLSPGERLGLQPPHGMNE